MLHLLDLAADALSHFVEGLIGHSVCPPTNSLGRIIKRLEVFVDSGPVRLVRR